MVINRIQATVREKRFVAYKACCSCSTTFVTTLQNLNKSIYFASTTWYSHSEDSPVHGSGQGSCASPCIWLLIFSILKDCLASKGDGMKAYDVVSTIPNQQWIDGFVDDTSIFTNQDDNNSTIDDLM